MKSETEIRQKLEYYQVLSSTLKAGRMIDDPQIFLLISSWFPKEAMELLTSSSRTDGIIKRLPPEDRTWITKWLEATAVFAEQMLETRINILKWILEMDAGAGGVTREGV